MPQLNSLFKTTPLGLAELAVCVGAALVILPIAAFAASPAREELDSALRARPNPQHGAELFATCAACHGPNGEGASDASVPRIGGQHQSVLVRQLVDFRHNRRRDNRMEHFADKHHLTNAQEIADVASFVSELRPEVKLRGGDESSIRHGASVYFRLCETCHGPVGEGDPERAVPMLAGQHAQCLLRQLHDAVEGRRPNFSRQHISLLSPLERDDFVGLSEYLSRLVPGKRVSTSGAGSAEQN